MRGRLITIEGIDGTGKTTLAEGLAAELTRRGTDVVLMREPGGVELSERIRTLVKDPQLTVGARAEALLYAAARAQLVEQALAPTLEEGRWVLLDRFVDSSLAYQGAGRELGIAEIRALNAFGTGGLEPDRTLLLTLEPPAARARARSRTPETDRLEQEEDDFFERIQAAYLSLANDESDRVRTLDASRSPETVLRDALLALTGLI
jgi:dTMP kinase